MLTRELIENVFSRIPKSVKVGVFGVYNTGCGEAKICVFLGMKTERDEFGNFYEYEIWEPVAIDDEISKNFDALVAKAVNSNVNGHKKVKPIRKTSRPATEKQINYATYISSVLGIPVPKENSVATYSKWIGEHVDQFKRVLADEEEKACNVTDSDAYDCIGPIEEEF